MSHPEFLPGVPVDYVLQRFALAGGNEVESGKLASPESSAALAANCFAWFAHRPHLLPPFPGLEAAYPPLSVDIEYNARFPWSGGRHPWMDAMITTPAEVIGVESKRFEPFRGAKRASLSEAYDRPVWGDNMREYEKLRDGLRSGEVAFKYLDATQLVKHALGLLAEGQRSGKRPILVYLFAEPTELAGRPIPPSALATHRDEACQFADLVKGSDVQFLWVSYASWVSSWTVADIETADHGRRLSSAFAL
jgi:hypothetical protein